ncbi:MAG: DUF5107 domain-containing protein [bacterium]|nr:DUF5107 domain-containing protein [bacterium]
MRIAFNRKGIYLLVIGIVAGFAAAAWSADSSVRAWEDEITLPTYETGEPEANPMFYTHESYQGAQKRMYPYPVIDDLSRHRIEKTYKALMLENEYVQFIVLPEIGGRLFGALDKTNGYNFLYRQHVIKPALIGMLGAWISGGIEWCVFHHHRNTTFMPLDYAIEDNGDGSKTVWFGETERRHRMKWLIGLTLRPGASYVEAQIRMTNRTPLANSILYWANVAVHVNDDYQVIFPPSVQVATYHSKIDFTHWPISNEVYRGEDYRGKDVSWWKNSKSANSFFAWHLQEDFMGGYDHGRDAGMVHVGDHHIVTGAKLWEWGTGPFGRRWDDILTDEDGPYAELMVGAYSDNQPDYSWIKPHEVKAFKQYWYPISGIDGFKNANLNGAVNLEKTGEREIRFGFCPTRRIDGVHITLSTGGETIYENTADVAPGQPFNQAFALPKPEDFERLKISVTAPDGAELIAYQQKALEPADRLPETVKPPQKPEDIKTNEELFYTGMRVEQIHNPSVDPMAYFNEALQRDPGDVRSNIAAASIELKQFLYEEAEAHLRTALQRLTADYTRPENCEANYLLGLALRAQGRLDEARDQLFRATWDSAFRSPAYYQLAELAGIRGDFGAALDHIQRSLEMNAIDTQALHLKAALLRRNGRLDEAMQTAEAVLGSDPLDFFAMNERALIFHEQGRDAEAEKAKAASRERMRDEAQSYLETAIDYLNAGMNEEAEALLERPRQLKMEPAGRFPLISYYLGFTRERMGDHDGAHEAYAAAAAAPATYCFPFRMETWTVLNMAIQNNPNDARAYYYLGDLLYEKQPEAAIHHWEIARKLDPDFATTHRNLGWAYYRTRNDLDAAIASYEKAIQCDPDDARLYYELDVLYERGNAAPERRLRALADRSEVVSSQNESLIREILVLTLNGKYERAIQQLNDNFFLPREGAGDVHEVYSDAHLLYGLQRLAEGDASGALEHFERAGEYPENLSVGRPDNEPRAAQILYYKALALKAKGDGAAAKDAMNQAAQLNISNRWPEARYYQALCFQQLGDVDRANKVFEKMCDDARQSVSHTGDDDYFAKFGERKTAQEHLAHAHYILGLGLLGLDKKEQAKAEFSQAVELNRGHVWARYELSMLN